MLKQGYKINHDIRLGDISILQLIGFLAFCLLVILNTYIAINMFLF